MINREILTPEVKDELKEHFSSTPPQSVTIRQFFTPQYMEQVQRELSLQEFVQIKAPLSHVYSLAQPGLLLQQSLEDKEILELLSLIIGKEVVEISGKVIRMGWRDYTLLHDEQLPPPGYDLIIELTPQWNIEHGGSIIYRDAAGNTSALPIIYGSLSIVHRTEHVHYYIKYINHHAQQQQRYLLMAELQVET